MTGHPALYRQRRKRTGRLVERSRMHGIQRGRRLLTEGEGGQREQVAGEKQAKLAEEHQVHV